jgi:hypothetical protein
MLPRPDAPARRLPYTTADMSERLAKRKAEQDSASFKAFPGGVTKPFDQNGGASSPSWLSQVGNMAKSLVLTAPATILDAIPYVANIPGVKGEGAWGYEPEDIGTSNFFQAGGQALEQSTRHLVGDVTAIPGLGKDSPSYTADQIREQGVARGVLGAAIDYSQFIPVVAKGAGVTGDVLNAYKLARMERAASPFPALRYADDVIDVDALQGSRLPARVVDSPATPATRLADAQTQRALTPQPVAPAVEIVKLPWSRKLPNSRVVKYTEPHLDEYGNLLKNGRNITLKVLDKNTKNMTGAMNIDVDFATQTATLEMMGVVDEFAIPQLAAAALYELQQFDFLKTQYPLIPSPNIPRPLIEQLQQAGLIDPSYQIPTPGPQNAFDAVQGPNFVNEWQFNSELVPLNYQPYFDSIMESLSPTKVLEPNFVINSPDAAHYFVANGGALDKVPSEHLWQSIQNNGFEGGRFDVIGSAGGHIGMDRFVDKATGQHLGLKYAPGKRFLFKNPQRQSNGFYTSTLDGPLGEILSNEIAVALGFPDMNLRLIVNGDGTVSIITDLAQDVYGGKILDSYTAELPANANLPKSLAPANFVPVEDRIRMAVLDDLISNQDRNISNVLFSVDEAGGVRLVPIDHEITFGGFGGFFGVGYPSAMNYSIRLAYFADPSKLFKTIKATITKIQQDLQNSQVVKRFESKLLETTKKVGIDFTDLNAVDKWDFDNQIQAFENRVKIYLSETPENLAQKFIKQIEEYVNP